MKLCVIGGGVQGVTTALELQAQFGNAHVTILANKFLKETTSDVAAGIFRPSINFPGVSLCHIVPYFIQVSLLANCYKLRTWKNCNKILTPAISVLRNYLAIYFRSVVKTLSKMP